MPAACRSTHGVDALIAQTLAHHEAQALAAVFSPLLPDHCPWQSIGEVPAAVVAQDGWRLTHIRQALDTLSDSLTQVAHDLIPYLSASEQDIRELALQYARRRLPGIQKLAWAERLLGAPIPGKNLAARQARANDARFWRRAIRVMLLRAREHFFLRLGLIGHRQEKYASDAQLATRAGQLRRQTQWMKDTVLIARFPAPEDRQDGPLTLASVAKSPVEHFAKLYTFVKAIDAIAIEQELAAGMLTITLEPEWHPNPSFGTKRWNGKSPREAHRSMGRRWQAVLRDLDRAGVGLSGLRVVEPHQDSCPHWHLWLLYRPEVEQPILETVMKYFPNKLKIRNPQVKPSDGQPAAAARPDEVYETLCDLRNGAARLPAYAKEGAQVELSRINRSLGSGASYAMKYLLKTVDAGEKMNKDAGLVPSGEDKAQAKERREQHKATAKRVDAYRSLWGINAGQLFGVAKCLTAWDELRRLEDAPSDAQLAKLWALARGSDKPGRIAAGAGQRGDAKGFIEALGGLAACGKPSGSRRMSIGRLTRAKTNAYGEAVEHTVGVTLIERERVRQATGTRIHRGTGEVLTTYGWRSVKRVLATVVTRLREWTLAPKRMAKLRTQQAAGLYVPPKSKLAKPLAPLPVAT